MLVFKTNPPKKVDFFSALAKGRCPEGTEGRELSRGSTAKPGRGMHKG